MRLAGEMNWEGTFEEKNMMTSGGGKKKRKMERKVEIFKNEYLTRNNLMTFTISKEEFVKKT